MPNKKNKPTTLNILRLKFLLKGNDYTSVKTLSELLNVSIRQIYRYLTEIGKDGNLNLKNEGDAYRIVENIDLAQVNSSKELLALYDAVQNNSLSVDQSQKLLKIVTESSCMWEEKEPEKEKKNRKIIATIQRAIDNKTKFLIKTYVPRDKPPSDRMITPVLLDKNKRRVYGLEKGHRKCFNFENMMGGVELTRVKAEVFEGWDPNEGADPFGFMKPSENRQPISVEVLLTPFSHSQLIRQFSHMRKYITNYAKIDKNYPFLLTIAVWDIQPIARFCVGLLHSVKILGSDDAIRQIKDYADSKVIKEGYNNNFSTI